MAHVVALTVTPGAPVFEVAVPCEVFGTDRRDLVDPWYELRLCSYSGPVAVGAGLVVPAPTDLSALADADTVIVGACARPVQVNPPADLLDALRAASARGARIASICSGAYLLAAAGLLDGRDATTHWMNAVDFAYRYPTVRLDPTVLYIGSGGIWTSAGTGAAIDLCLHLVRQDHGAAVANEVARRMVVPPYRDGGQAQFVPPSPAPARTGDLDSTLDWARQRLNEPLTVAQLASRAHLSPRTFARRFRDTMGVSPLQWLLEQRVRLAQELLESTDEPVERIAGRIGFGTAASLRHHFGRITGVSPRTYRHVFRDRQRA